MSRLEDLEKQIDKIVEERDETFRQMYAKNPKAFMNEFFKTSKPFDNRIKPLSMEARSLREPEMRKDDVGGDLFELDQFAHMCTYAGGFNDSDGSAYYATATQVSDIPVYPSDFFYPKHQQWIRKDFTHVMWYNK